MELQATTRFQDQYRRILRMRQWKQSGDTLAERGDIAGAANFVSISSKKQILEASIFEGGNKDLATAKLFTTSMLPDHRWLRICYSVLFGSLGCL